MKTTIIYKYVCIVALLLCTVNVNAQFVKGLGDKAKKAAERTVERRVERESSKKTDQAIDSLFTGKKNKEKEKATDDRSEKEKSANITDKQQTEKQLEDKQKKVNGNSDFEQGNKVLFTENFSEDSEGDLPASWNTTGSAKVTRLAGSDTRWMELSSPGVFIWDKVKALPENFTLEFDLFVPSTFSYYDYPLWIVIGDMKNKRELMIWEKYKEKRGKEKRNGALLVLHPQEEGGKKLGYSEYEIWEDSERTAFNKKKALSAFNVNNNSIKVQLWKQQQRLRVYIDGEKIWDLPQAFISGQNLNTILFSRYEAKDGNYFYISNLRLAASEDDVRSKILKEGRYSTNAILFTTNSSVILPQSDAALQEIAAILKENPSLKLTIIGHTDNAGQKENNLALSKQRAASVKNELTKKYGIPADRLNTDGKGATEPVADNSTAEGKSKNRRVEFLRN